MAIQAKGMALKHFTRIVYSTPDKDFDELDVFDDFEFVNFFISWLRFTKYKIFQKK